MHFTAVPFFLLFAFQVYAAAILPRSTDLTCTDLRVKSNDGGRKIAIVIDSSGSMSSSDPYDLRIAAGRSLNDFLITSKEATSSKKADQVTVIDFDDVATLDYPLGDPGPAANSSFSSIDAFGGTYIAGGIQMAISQLTTAGSGATAGRSGIVVFTDGEDVYTSLLVDAINNATSLGIRVSFGFLDDDSSYQDKEVLVAIGKSGGIYSTITSEDSSQNFINYAILNGLTTKDNPAGDNSTLLAGLATAHFTGGSQTQTITYNARAHEHIDFTIESIDAGSLTAELLFSGKSKNKTEVSYYNNGYLSYSAGSAGEIDIKVSATNAPADSLFVVGAVSNMPAQNCTVGVGSVGGGGLSTGGKAGLGVGIPLVVGLFGLLGYFLWKNWGKLPKFPKLKIPDLYSGPHGAQAMSWDPQPSHGLEKAVASVPPSYPLKPGPDETHHSIHSVSSLSDSIPSAVPPATNPANKHHKLRLKKRKADQEYHHHHLPPGHPCYVSDCSQAQTLHQCKDYRCLCADPTNPMPNHKCEDIKFPCACTDPECPSNNPKHTCLDPEYPCACSDETCPLSEEQKKKRRTDMAFGFGLKGVNVAGTHLMNAM